MNTKVCPRCGRKRRRSSFNKHRARPDGMQSICRDCQNAGDRAFHARTPRARYAQKQRRIQELRDWYQAYRATLCCASCPESDPVCLDFHHRTDDKTTNVANMVSSGWAKERIIEEIEKCAVLCANCHRKLHAHGPVV
jgi:hypothetical protein